MSSEAIRLLRIIARLNVGGPAIQALTLTRRLDDRGYATRLVRGSEGADEGSMDWLARELGVDPTLVRGMRRDPGAGDLAALWALVQILRRDRPQIVHTHAAKAGTLGRVATMIAFPRRRPLLVHTFHGHSLSGYFSSRTAGVYRCIERRLARRTDALVAVSPEVRDDLVQLGIAAPAKFSVVPLGLDLSGFLADDDRAARRATLRAEWGIGADERVVTLVARLVPIKRVDRFLRVAGLLASGTAARFVIVGDGQLRDSLHSAPEAAALGDRLIWAGFRKEMRDVCFASDVVVLTSDNEGTPVSLIEAQAAAVPVVGTDVGGVRSVIRHRETGMLAVPADEHALATAISEVLADPRLAAELARAGRQHASQSFGIDRLVADLDRLYRRLLEDRRDQA
jgi:glycosyltransferase involved in cell wall biosynthesis